jgi:hypothetical protein
MLQLSESAGQLTLQAPVWIGLLVLAMGVALAVYVVRGKAKGKVFGAGMAALICIGFGWHLLYAKTRFDDAGIVVRGALGVDASASWGEITAVSVQDLKKGKGGPSPFLVLARESGPEVEVGIGGLDVASRARLIEYARAKASPASR